MQNRKYPISLFVIGLITNLLFRFFWLFVPSIVLLMIGIFVKPCLYIGLALLLLDAVLALAEQIRIRRTVLKESDNPDFMAFQDALSKDGGWKDNVEELLNQKISDPPNEDKPNEKSENQ